MNKVYYSGHLAFYHKSTMLHVIITLELSDFFIGMRGQHFGFLKSFYKFPSTAKSLYKISLLAVQGHSMKALNCKIIQKHSYPP